MQNDGLQLLWNTPPYSQRKKEANKSDLVILDKPNETITVIEFSVPFDSNRICKFKKKGMKHADLV